MLANQATVSYRFTSRVFHTAHRSLTNGEGRKEAGLKADDPQRLLDARKSPLGRFGDQGLG